MAKINLETLTLLEFDKNDPEHVSYLKELLNDETITSRFYGLLPMLMNNSKDFFNRGYFVMDEDEFVGYIDAGAYNYPEKSVYLRGAIKKELRGMGYGKMMLGEVSDYIFANYDKVDYIKLKSATDNTKAVKTIESCGYSEIFDGLYYLERSRKDVSIKGYEYIHK